MKIEISKIKIKKRARKDLGDLEALASSMKRNGLITPIAITTDNVLIAGERRLEAAKLLGWKRIDAHVVNQVSKDKLLEIEIEENTFRLPFTKEELLDGYHKLNKLKNPGFFMRIWLYICYFFKKLFRKI